MFTYYKRHATPVKTPYLMNMHRPQRADGPLTDPMGAYGPIIIYTLGATQERLLGERESHLLLAYDGALDYCWR